MRGDAVAVLVLALAGCGKVGDRPATAPSETVKAETTAPALALEIEGLRLVDPDSGKASALSFGLPRDTVQQAVAKVTGLAPETSSMSECPAGPMDFARFGSLTLNFANGMFAGWSLTGGEPKLTTMDGIGIGSTRKDVEAAREVQMMVDSTLGEEFIIAPISDEANLSGIFDARGAEAKVETLWAGAACNFR